jgi:molybdopterin-guanine dinucleotide biosynthesis protein A
MEQMLARGEYRIFDFYQQVRAAYIDVQSLPVAWKRAFINLNTPDDLRRMAKEKT